MRDGQLPAVIELKHQHVRQDVEDPCYSRVALGALQGDFIPRAGPQVKTRRHDPSSRPWHTATPGPMVGRSMWSAEA